VSRHPENPEWLDEDYFIIGRHYELAEWRFEQEQKELKQLIKRLQERERARKRREADPERLLEATRRWRERRAAAQHPHQHKRPRKRSGERLVHPRDCRYRGTCEQCGDPWRYDRPRRYCSARCRREAERWRARGEPKGTKHPDLRGAISRVLREDPWLSARMVAELGSLKPSSVAVTLLAMERAGEVRASSGRPKLYVLASTIQRAHSRELIAAVRTRYRAGMSMRAIAADIGRSVKLVWTVVNRYGVKKGKA
jgi:hypothetical protein